MATTSQKFEVYVSKIRDYVQSQVQTTAIDLPGNTTAFTLKPEGTALEKVSWAYSGNNGETWTEIDVNAEDDTVIKDAPDKLIIRATLTPDGEELPTVTGFNLALLSITGNSKNYFFTGKEKDASCLYYFGARYYDPEVGRFISEDLGRDGVNWYGYCDGNPVNYIDPDGCVAETVWDAFNIGLDFASIMFDIKTGQWLDLAIDTGCLLGDSGATLVPVVPGGLGAVRTEMTPVVKTPI